MAKQEWHKVQDVKAFLADKGQRTTGQHAFTKKVLHWPYCSRCGLLALKNETTRREMSRPCVTEE